jgi:pyruvyltransferase
MSILRDLKVKYLFVSQYFERLYYSKFNIEHVPLLYYNIRNWGDQLNPILVEKISQKKIRSIDIDTLKGSSIINENKYMVIGSILHHADSNTIVWGAGLITDKLLPKVMPKNILAVRGPLTGKVLNNAGYKCPTVYGDPALLLPIFFPQRMVMKKKLGIILHNDDLNFKLPQWVYDDDEVDIIFLRGDEFTILEKITSCENIASSSLHGLIVADAYSIPSRRLILNGKLYGGDFKFDDYYSSLSLKSEEPLVIDTTTSKIEIIKACNKKEVTVDLELLLSVCPFLPEQGN